MGKKTMKSAALAAVLGTLCGWGGCLDNDSWWGKAFWGTVGYSAMEFVLDNDAVFDLFEDGATA